MNEVIRHGNTLIQIMESACPGPPAYMTKPTVPSPVLIWVHKSRGNYHGEGHCRRLLPWTKHCHGSEDAANRMLPVLDPACPHQFNKESCHLHCLAIQLAHVQTLVQPSPLTMSAGSNLKRTTVERREFTKRQKKIISKYFLLIHHKSYDKIALFTYFIWD